MADETLADNAEARWRRSARTAQRIALFLFALLAGALLWSIVLVPVFDPVVRNAGMESLGRAMLRAAVADSPALFLAFAACQAMGILGRFARGRARLASSALSVSVIGASISLAGAMSVFGAPTLLAMLGGMFEARFAFTSVGVGLLALGGILALTGRALTEG